MQNRIRREAHFATAIFEDAPQYEEQEVVRLANLLQVLLYGTESESEKEPILEEFVRTRDAIRPVRQAVKHLLWPDNNLPEETVYEDNPDHRYNHDPGFLPYYYEMLLPPTIPPKGAVIAIAGGDHGYCSVYEGYQICKDFLERGYQTFLLNNRTNFNPWTEYESGVDVARLVRIIRANAARYRISPDSIAVAGFSNGGLTAENCILYYSGKKTVQEHFSDYVPDELDQVSATPNAFLCVYGPRYKGSPYCFDGVEYPPTFFAVGRDDRAMDNLNYVYPILIAQGVPVEMHTFAGTPHGVAGKKLVDGVVRYPLFETWLDLADAFLMDAYQKQKGHEA